jgi:hypothetical protein
MEHKAEKRFRVKGLSRRRRQEMRGLGSRPLVRVYGGQGKRPVEI